MEEKGNWLDEMFGALNSLNHQAILLEDLANAFARTGNGRVADELYDISKKIESKAKSIRVLVGKDINRQHRQAQEMSGAVLNAALAGCIIGKTDKN